MGAINGRLRRHRRNRLAAELYATYTPRRSFTFGTSVGWAHWYDNPDDLYRRRNRLTYTGFSGATSGTPGTAPTSGWLFGSTGGSQTVSGGSVTFTTAGLARQFFYTPTAAATLAAGESAVFTVTVEAVNITAGATVVAYLAVTSGSTSAQTFIQASQGAGRHTCYVTAGSGGCTVEARLGVGVSANATGTVTVKDPQVETRTLTATTYQDVPTTWPEAYLAAVGAENIYAWTDNLGTTPVTAAGDTIGLSLDRAFGGYRGPELKGGGAVGLVGSATAATYNTGTGAGTATRVDASNQSFVTLSGFGATGMAECTIQNTGAVTINVRITDQAGAIQTTVTAGATSSFRVPTAANGNLYITAGAAGSIAFTINSARSIPGAHLIQATSTARPTLSARVNLLLNTATMSTQNVTTIAASYKLSFTGTGTVTLSGTSTAGPLVGTGANDRVSLTFTPTAGTLTLTVSGSVTLADLRTADDAAKSIPAYQRVGATAADHDTDGFPHCALFDGTDDSWASAATVDGSGSDKVTVVTGATKNSDAADGTVIAFGDPSSAESGTFIMQAPGSSAVTKIQFSSRGATTQAVPFTASTAYNAPISMVARATADIGAPLAQLAVNGVTVSSITTTQGGGNYNSARSVSVGQRIGGTARLNGRIYSLVGRFGAMGEADLNRLERWTKNLMRLP